MSTRVVRTIYDFSRHGFDIDVLCGCGHKATLCAERVKWVFHVKGWARGIDAARRHFRCTRCGGRPVRIGPIGR